MFGDRIHHNRLLCPHPRHRLFTPIGSGDHFQKVCKGSKNGGYIQLPSFLPQSDKSRIYKSDSIRVLENIALCVSLNGYIIN